ncbi:hypothetical protein I79_023484 [Cricetulus griseus]|uniref:Uncharacterized protein n=1 Tax=Cricetulus griseus TaxID=10029 RepID=G3II23_CRIGR|nr:hypothetical protein I79_023484 [Cricetulus griseus]
MIFNHFKDLQNIAFKVFNNLRLFMIVRHVCSWQHQFTSEKMMGIEETPYGVSFIVAKKLFLS